MPKVTPKTGSYSSSVTDDAKSVAQSVDRSWWRDKGEIRSQDEIYTARRDKSSYVLESATGVLARAAQPRKGRRELFIEHSGHLYTLRAKSAFRRDLMLFEDSTPSIPWWAVAGATGFSAMVGMLFGILPARRAANLAPIDALRHE